MTDKSALYKTAREVFEEATTPVLGLTVYKVLCFHLEQRIGKDPYEILLEDPQKFYEEFEKLFAKGTDVLLNYVGKCLEDKYCTNFSPEKFVELLYKGDESSKDKMIEIMTTIYEKKKRVF